MLNNAQSVLDGIMIEALKIVTSLNNDLTLTIDDHNNLACILGSLIIQADALESVIQNKKSDLKNRVLHEISKNTSEKIRYIH